MSIEKILLLDRAPDDELAQAQQALSQTALRLCKEGVSSHAIGVAALQMVVFTMVKIEGQLATAEILESLAYGLMTEKSDHVADMEVRGEA